MSSTVSHARSPAVSPASPAGYAAALFIGAALLALSSYLTIPMAPVPITLQTLAVTLIGAVCAAGGSAR